VERKKKEKTQPGLLSRAIFVTERKSRKLPTGERGKEGNHGGPKNYTGAITLISDTLGGEGGHRLVRGGRGKALTSLQKVLGEKVLGTRAISHK